LGHTLVAIAASQRDFKPKQRQRADFIPRQFSGINQTLWTWAKVPNLAALRLQHIGFMLQSKGSVLAFGAGGAYFH
jgi:hypothetical protein